MMRSFGTSICGLRSGTQNWQRRPQPVVISTTPNVVRLSGTRMLLAIPRMADVDLPRQRLAADRAIEQRHRVGRLAAALDDAVDAELVPGVGLRDLPAAGTADDHLEAATATGSALTRSNSLRA